MKYILYVYDGKDGEQYAFGLYDKEQIQRILDIYGDESGYYTLSAIPLNMLSEAVDNPIAYLSQGDAPDE